MADPWAGFELVSSGNGTGASDPWAGFEVVSQPQTQPQESAFSRFMGGVGEDLGAALNPMNLVNFIAHPVESGAAFREAQGGEFAKAYDEAAQGNYGSAVARGVLGSIPFVGPALGQAADVAVAGDDARALGKGTAQALLAFSPKIVPKVAPVARRAAGAAARGAGEVAGVAMRHPGLAAAAGTMIATGDPLSAAVAGVGGRVVGNRAGAILGTLSDIARAKPGAIDASKFVAEARRMADEAMQAKAAKQAAAEQAAQRAAAERQAAAEPPPDVTVPEVRPAEQGVTLPAPKAAARGFSPEAVAMAQEIEAKVAGLIQETGLSKVQIINAMMDQYPGYDPVQWTQVVDSAWQKYPRPETIPGKGAPLSSAPQRGASKAQLEYRAQLFGKK